MAGFFRRPRRDATAEKASWCAPLPLDEQSPRQRTSWSSFFHPGGRSPGIAESVDCRHQNREAPLVFCQNFALATLAGHKCADVWQIPKSSPHPSDCCRRPWSVATHCEEPQLLSSGVGLQGGPCEVKRKQDRTQRWLLPGLRGAPAERGRIPCHYATHNLTNVLAAPLLSIAAYLSLVALRLKLSISGNHTSCDNSRASPDLRDWPAC